MITVYFDTNVYIAAKFIFDNKKFSEIRKLLSNNEIKLLYSTATMNEVKKHIKDDIGCELRSYNAFIKKT